MGTEGSCQLFLVYTYCLHTVLTYLACFTSCMQVMTHDLMYVCIITLVSQSTPLTGLIGVDYPLTIPVYL